MKSSRNIVLIALLAFSLLSPAMKAQSIELLLTDAADIVVAKDGSGDFLTIQEAIHAIPDDNPVRKIIFIKNGIYFEKVVVPFKKSNITMIGEDMDSTVLVYDDSPAKGDTFWTMNTYTFRVDADDFRAMNMTISNTAGNSGQALALFGNGDRQIYTHCRFLGYQDTYYITMRVRNYFKDCFIEGATDYIFGFGVAVFDSCQIHSVASGYITAASTPLDYKFGLVFRDCSLTASPKVTGVSLGRPWFDYARTVFMKCLETSAILKEGWSPWSGREATCYYREYQCFGEGADTTRRVSYGRQLTDQEAEKYQLDTIFALSNFPVDAVHDTAELFVPYRRFDANAAVLRPELFFKSGKDTFVTYPAAGWKVNVEGDSLYRLIKNNTCRVLDSINNIYSVQNLFYNNTPIPGFDPSVTLYGIELGDQDTVPPVITAEAEDALVSVTYPKTLPGYSTVLITSKNKVNQSLFRIYNSIDSAFWNADLKVITYHSGKDTIPLQPGVYEYDVVLPAGTTAVPVVSAKIVVAGSIYTITQAASLPGTAIIDVTAIDVNVKRQYKIHFSVATGISDDESDHCVPVIQNPFREQVHFAVDLKDPFPVSFDLFDISGRKVLSEEFTFLHTGHGTFDVNSDHLQQGIYSYSIIMNGRIFTGKLVKSE